MVQQTTFDSKYFVVCTRCKILVRKSKEYDYANRCLCSNCINEMRQTSDVITYLKNQSNKTHKSSGPRNLIKQDQQNIYQEAQQLKIRYNRYNH